jgi:hypothetical protein
VVEHQPGSAALAPLSAAANSGSRSVSDQLRDAVGKALRRAQDAGAARPGVDVAEVYLILRGLAQATATTTTAPGVVDRAVAIVLGGLSHEADG